jgi:hypothetical protein
MRQFRLWDSLGFESVGALFETVLAKENLCEPALLRFRTWVAAGEGGFETGLLGPVGATK